MVTTLWQVRLLGGLRLQCGERIESRFRTQKTAALLSYLALYPQRTHPREELAVRFWCEDGDEEARRSLRVALSSLRRQLEAPDASEGELLVADRAVIGLRPEAFTTDVAQFEEALTRAARLARTAPQSREERLALLLDAANRYEAPLLPGFYEEWILTERERLHSRFLDALEEAEDLLRKLGRDGEADAIAQRREQSLSSDSVVPTGNIEQKTTVEAPRPTVAVPSVHPVSTNLPLFFTRFFGREREMTTLIASMDDPSTPLMTLLGPGGIGKTRLAVEAARRWGRESVFVPLASVVRGEEITDALRDALKIAPSSEADTFAAVTGYLRELSTTNPLPLLAFDNFEQIEEESGARFMAKLLRTIPGIRCLVSSRRRLGVPGEVTIAVETLSLPEEGETNPATLLQSASIALFADRARSATPDFAVTTRNAAGMVTLVRLLDGLPLAIELAAAWASVLSPGQMATKLLERGERFGLLTSRRTADRTERHRSLWNTIAWSYNLLPAELRRLWRRLSVFQGGFTAAMAETVAGDGFSLDGLARLRERSLIRLMEEADGDEDEPRYELLESLREFAMEQVADEETPEEQSALLTRHMLAIKAIVDAGAEYGMGPRHNAFTLRYKRELPNARAILAHAEAGRVSLEEGLHLAVRYSRIWRFGYVREGIGIFQSLLHRPESELDAVPPIERARALFHLNVLLQMQGKIAEAEQAVKDALDVFRGIDYTAGICSCLLSLGILAQDKGDLAQAETYYREALTLNQQMNNRVGIANVLNNLGYLARERKEYDAMRQWYEEELAIRRELSDIGGAAVALGGLAVAMHELGEGSIAETHFHESFRLALGIEHKYSLTYSLLGYADLLADRGEWERATLVYGAGAALRTEQGVEFYGVTEDEIQHCQARCKAALGTKQFGAVLARGQSLRLADAVGLALGESK